MAVLTMVEINIEPLPWKGHIGLHRVAFTETMATRHAGENEQREPASELPNSVRDRK
jgi:hypothetical protein